MIAVDVEASGIGPETHSILSVGAVDLSNPTNTFYEECRVWEGAHINDDALAVCGFTREQATDPNKQSEAELVHKFAAFAQGISDRTLAGQNVSFDRDLLQAAAARAKHTEWPFAHRTIDSHTLCLDAHGKEGTHSPD
jgi:DNA polymerase III epsilon subunit-like protein